MNMFIHNYHQEINQGIIYISDKRENTQSSGRRSVRNPEQTVLHLSHSKELNQLTSCRRICNNWTFVCSYLCKQNMTTATKCTGCSEQRKARNQRTLYRQIIYIFLLKKLTTASKCTGYSEQRKARNKRTLYNPGLAILHAGIYINQSTRQRNCTIIRHDRAYYSKISIVKRQKEEAEGTPAALPQRPPL